MKLNRSIFLMVPLFLCSCTDNGLLLRSNGSYQNQGENIYYMVGDPYTIEGENFVPKEDYTYIEEGLAGWYTYDKDHPITQNGETYKKDVYSAMHRTLPLPSIVKVTNLENNEAVIVRVNERGPMVKNRIIDVSKEAADVLKLNKNKATKVLVEIMAVESQVLKTELLKQEGKDALKNSRIVFERKNTETLKETSNLDESEIVYQKQNSKKTTSKFVIQIGAFRNNTSAENLKNQLAEYDAFIVQKNVNNMVLNCVQIGGLKTKKEALITLDKIKASGYSEARIMTK